MSWVTELAQAENDALRASGDVEAIRSKYDAAAGALSWSDAPFGEFNSTVGDTWVKALTGPQRTALFDTHMDVEGNVTLSNGPTRTALAGVLTAEQITAFTSAYSTQGTLADTLGLPRATRAVIVHALTNSADGFYRDNVRAKVLRRAIAEADLKATSLTNLETIVGIIGT